MNNSALPPLHNPELHGLVFDLIKKESPGKVLDIPSGPGYFSQKIQKIGFQSVAAEIDPSLYALKDVQYQSIDMSRPFPLPDCSYDYIVSIEGIEHIENQFAFLRECHRILKDGGKLFLTTPNVSSLKKRLIFFLTGAHTNPIAPIRDDLDNIFFEHINLIPFHRLETFLRHSGFQIQKMTSYSWQKISLIGRWFFYPLLYKILRSSYKRYFRREDEKYWNIFKMYLSKEVLCGGEMVIVAVKP